MNPTPTEIEQLLAALAATPRRLADMTENIEPTRLQNEANADAWSVNDILAHLRACADIWGKGIMAMIAEDRPILRYVSPRTWIRKTNYPKQDFRLSFQAYTQQREELLRSLSILPVDNWSRSATFKTTGKDRIETVFDYARRITSHEAQHLEQVEELVQTIRPQQP